MTAAQRNKEVSAATLERERQIEAGREMEHAAITAQPEETLLPQIEVPVIASRGLPLDHTIISHDLQIKLPEAYHNAIGGGEYLNLENRPLISQEAHRVGVFLLTQLDTALHAVSNLAKSDQRCADLMAQVEELRQAIKGIEAQNTELHASVEHYRTLLKDTEGQLEESNTKLREVQDFRDLQKLNKEILEAEEQEKHKLREELDKLKSDIYRLIGD